MSKCNFIVDVAKENEEIKQGVTSQIEEAGGNIAFDGNIGKFDVETPAGDIAGKLEIKEETVEVAITDKPAMLPCGMIESVLKGYL